jgi:serine/threonine-protein kinase
LAVPIGAPSPEIAAWRIKVLDFGLAGRASPGSAIAGTLGYMAPELFSNRRASASSDIYAVGMVLAELLLGAHPFSMERTELMLIKHVKHTTPDLSGLNHPALMYVLDSALHKTPARRPADAALFMRQLADAMSGDALFRIRGSGDVADAAQLAR